MNRLEHREIPLFWSHEELGPLRKSIEKWYSSGMPLSTIIKRCLPVRLQMGRRPLIHADIYAALQDGIKRNSVTQRFNTQMPEMPVSTFRHFFAAFRDGGSLAVCMERISVPIPPDRAGDVISPPFINVDVCNKMFRSMSERWRSECRGSAQALIKPKREVLATRANMDQILPHEKAMKIAQRVYDMVIAELCGGGPLELPDTGEIEEPEEAISQAPALPEPVRLGPPPPLPLPAPEQQLNAGIAEDVADLDIENLSDDDQLEPEVKGQLKTASPSPATGNGNPFE